MEEYNNPIFGAVCSLNPKADRPEGEKWNDGFNIIRHPTIEAAILSDPEHGEEEWHAMEKVLQLPENKQQLDLFTDYQIAIMRSDDIRAKDLIKTREASLLNDLNRKRKFNELVAARKENKRMSMILDAAEAAREVPVLEPILECISDNALEEDRTSRELEASSTHTTQAKQQGLEDTVSRGPPPRSNLTDTVLQRPLRSKNVSEVPPKDQDLISQMAFSTHTAQASQQVIASGMTVNSVRAGFIGGGSGTGGSGLGGTGISGTGISGSGIGGSGISGGGIGGIGLCGSGIGGSGIGGIRTTSGSGKLVLLQYIDTDGRIIEVPKSTSPYAIDVDLPYRRMLGSHRMRDFAADNKYAFSFTNALEKVRMHVSRWDNDNVGIKADDLYAGLSNYHDYEGYAIWQNHAVLEKIISLNFMYGDLKTASFLYCHHAGVGKFDKTVRSHVADSLETMNVLIWIFLGNPWRHLLRDLVERIRAGDLKRYLSIDARTEACTFLVYHIHDALCKVSSLIRDDKSRYRTGDETEDIKTLVKECERILAVIPSADDEVSHSQPAFDVFS